VREDWRRTASGLPDRVRYMTSARGCEAGRGLTRIKITNSTTCTGGSPVDNTSAPTSHCARQSLYPDAFLDKFAPDNILIAPHRASFRRFRICLIAIVRSFHTSQGVRITTARAITMSNNYQQYGGNPYGQAEAGYGGTSNPYGSTGYGSSNPYGGGVSTARARPCDCD
jgi:hypothetical protein